MTVAEAVAYWMSARHSRGRTIPVEAVGAVWRGHQAGMTASEIATALGVTLGRVQGALRMYGISGEGRAGRPRKDRVPPDIDLLADQPFTLLDITCE